MKVTKYILLCSALLAPTAQAVSILNNNNLKQKQATGVALRHKSKEDGGLENVQMENLSDQELPESPSVSDDPIAQAIRDFKSTSDQFQKINEMVFKGPAAETAHVEGALAVGKVPKVSVPAPAPLYSATAVADEHFSDYLMDKDKTNVKANATALEQKMLKVIEGVKAKKQKSPSALPEPAEPRNNMITVQQKATPLGAAAPASPAEPAAAVQNIETKPEDSIKAEDFKPRFSDQLVKQPDFGASFSDSLFDTKSVVQRTLALAKDNQERSEHPFSAGIFGGLNAANELYKSIGDKVDLADAEIKEPVKENPFVDADLGANLAKAIVQSSSFASSPSSSNLPVDSKLDDVFSKMAETAKALDDSLSKVDQAREDLQAPAPVAAPAKVEQPAAVAPAVVAPKAPAVAQSKPELEKKNATAAPQAPLALSSTIKPTVSAAKPVLDDKQKSSAGAALNVTDSKATVIALPVAKMTTVQKVSSGAKQLPKQEAQVQSMTQVPQKKETPKEALKNAIAEAVSKPAKQAVESPKKIAADAIASIISPVKEALPATLAVTPVIPVSLPVKKQEVAPANPIAAVQKAIQKDDKKHDPSKDVPKRKSHWFMSILHSIGNFFSSLFSWSSSSKK